MKKILGLVFVLALAATPAMAQKVTIDYAHDFDFGSIKTFQYVNTKDTNPKNELMANRVVEMIKKELTEGGLTEVSENPDIYVTVHYASQERSSFTTTNFGYGGYWGGWGGWGYPSMGSSMTTEQTYTDGTLVIDAYDAKEKKMIWRGTGTVTVKDNPQKRIKQVEKIFNKLGKKWDKILAGKGK
jgi:hypothetical protein